VKALLLTVSISIVVESTFLAFFSAPFITRHPSSFDERSDLFWSERYIPSLASMEYIMPCVAGHTTMTLKDL